MEVTGLDRIKVASVSFLGFALACLIGWVGLDIFHNSSIILRLASMAFFISALITLVVAVIILASLFAPDAHRRRRGSSLSLDDMSGEVST